MALRYVLLVIVHCLACKVAAQINSENKILVGQNREELTNVLYTTRKLVESFLEDEDYDSIEKMKEHLLRGARLFAVVETLKTAFTGDNLNITSSVFQPNYSFKQVMQQTTEALLRYFPVPANMSTDVTVNDTTRGAENIVTLADEIYHLYELVQENEEEGEEEEYEDEEEEDEEEEDEEEEDEEETEDEEEEKLDEKIMFENIQNELANI